MILWGDSFFQKSSFSEKKKNQRQHRRNKAQNQVRKSEFSLELIFCIVKNRKQCFTKKTENLMEISMINSDFGENLIARGSIYEPFLICVTPSEDPSEVQSFE